MGLQIVVRTNKHGYPKHKVKKCNKKFNLILYYFTIIYKNKFYLTQ